MLQIVEKPVLLDRYIATCQLGITASSLLLGFYGQTSVAEAILPFLSQFGNLSDIAARSISATGVLLLLTALQVVLGELVPKNIGIQYPERLSLLTSIPTRWSMALFRPLIWFFNGSGQLLMKLFGLTAVAEHTHVHAPEEILYIAEESGEGGLLHQEERRLLENTLQLRESMVRQVMVPRTRVMAAPVVWSCEKLLDLLADSPYSRLPLYSNSLDTIVGVVHLKDLLCFSLGEEQQSVQEVMRPVLYVAETMPAGKVLAQLQRKHYHVAVVLDEFGGTAGLITLEDLIEEIFGDIQDEFEVDQQPFQLLSEDRLMVQGDILIRELNDWLDLYLMSDEVDTVGGLVLNAFGYVPRVGAEIETQGLTFRVEAMHGKGVAAVSLEVSPEQVERLKREAV